MNKHRFLTMTVIALSLSAVATVPGVSDSKTLPEALHGSPRVDYNLPTKMGEQPVTFRWVDSNPEAIHAVKVDWYPEDWYIKYSAPISSNTPDNSLNWIYKEYRNFNAAAAATFSNGDKVVYRFTIRVNEPRPIQVCASDSKTGCDFDN